MNGGDSKAWTRHSRVQLSRPLQELPRSHREQFPESEDPARDATPVPARKRLLDPIEGDPLSAKRARSTRTDTQQPGVEGRIAEQADETTLQQPKPNPPKRPYASFLKDFIDPVHPGPCPASIHTFVLEWLESVGSDREKHCRSDSHLHRSTNDPVSRDLTRSAPEMSYTRDTDGFVVPAKPESTEPRRSYQGTGDSAPSSASARRPSYRRNNLALNNIRIRDSGDRLPDYISSHVEKSRAKRDSPGPSSEEMAGYSAELDMLARGCKETAVAEFLADAVFPKNSDLTYGKSTGLESAKSLPMSSHLIPNNPECPFRVSGPTPDLLYGYSGELRDGAFTQPQFLAQTGLHPRNTQFPEATTDGLRFPFFAIEFKAAGGTRGDLWVATNQCAGASSACLTAINQLNSSLREHESVQRVDNLTYCIAVDNNTAQLYVSWKEDDLNYCLQRVDAFLLSDPEHFKNFRKQVRNILDWGKDTRLKQIRDALDIILEENRKKAAERAKTRQPPSDGSPTTTGKTRKSPSSRGRGGSSNRQ